MQNNPLQQYFRRPAVYISLPSKGIGYSPDDLDMPENKELPVYPMTAIDEITARTPDALFNGTAVVELIKSCVPNIKNPWAIKNIDMDAILIGIKAASDSETLEIDTKCPNCGTESTYSVSLLAVLSNFTAGDYDTPLEIGDLKFKFKPLTYKEMNQASMGQFEVQKFLNSIIEIEDIEERNKATKNALEKITYLTMEILAKTIEYIETPNIRVDDEQFILDFLKNCDNKIYNAIRDHSTKLKEGTEIKPAHIKCYNCGHEYDQPYTINPTDFFG
jgi:rubredoxin